ncbi:hypothetical protein AN964_17230 [Heyndrickxia shackletonii]|uniref:Uncharacterized protein n=2 Tax=Bacillaceae TaxID=186817 RepID=A0A0Q3WZY9_9BACI|nr:hypothetical protein [Heyndrickxia shackletonii]KQL55077.1 hypothetical protein AN964_17230 [Heyndrickxia shackletonii]
MAAITFFFFIISILLLAGMIYNILKHLQPGFYPPKRVLKQRVRLMAVGGILFGLLGFICMWIFN